MVEVNHRSNFDSAVIAHRRTSQSCAKTKIIANKRRKQKVKNLRKKQQDAKRTRKGQLYQFDFGAGSLLASPFGFDFELLLGQRLEVLVALQLQLLLGSENKDLLVVVVVAQMVSIVRALIEGRIGGAVVDDVLAELVNLANQLRSR